MIQTSTQARNQMILGKHYCNFFLYYCRGGGQSEYNLFLPLTTKHVFKHICIEVTSLHM